MVIQYFDTTEINFVCAKYWDGKTHYLARREFVAPLLIRNFRLFENDNPGQERRIKNTIVPV